MSRNDQSPGPAAKLLAVFCLAMAAAVTAASLIGMARGADREPVPYVTDCEAIAELCEEEQTK